MKIEDYDKRIEATFGWGGGGYYLKENYDESMRGEQSLFDIVGEMKIGILQDLQDDGEEFDIEEQKHLNHLLSLVPISIDECIDFFEGYIENKCCHPETCGAIAGIMFREGEREKVLDFLEINEDGESIFWDS